MPEVREVAQKVRSKNAGPFWITIDIFCGSDAAFQQISQGLATGKVAQVLDVPSQTLKRFDIPDLHVVKLSLPRREIQGTLEDRDMHGAALAVLVGEIVIA